jgi:hypothetical protein
MLLTNQRLNKLAACRVDFMSCGMLDCDRSRSLDLHCKRLPTSYVRAN